MPSDSAIVSMPKIMTDDVRHPIENNTNNENFSDGALLILSPVARAVEIREQRMTILQALALYWPAVWYSGFWSGACLMEGFDLTLINSSLGFHEFNKYYGNPYDHFENGHWAIDYFLEARWKVSFNVGTLVGQMVGLALSGLIAERFGYKKTMLMGLGSLCAFITIVFLAPSPWLLLLGQFLCGIPWGMFQTIPTTYAVEVVPPVLRPYSITWINLCWLLGQFIASGVMKGTVILQNKWAFKIPFALQWIFPIGLLLVVLYSPESPVWLVQQGRLDDARTSLIQLTRRDVDEVFNLDATIQYMIETDNIEKTRSAGTSYLDCFRKKDLRRTGIAIGAWAAQSLCGSVIIGLAAIFYEAAGVNESMTYTYVLIQYPLAITGAICSWFLIAKFPRRKLFLSGLAALSVALFATGCSSWSRTQSVRVAIIVALWNCFVFIYGSTLGPLAYAIAAEIGSTRMRSKTIVIARIGYNLCNIAANFVTITALTPSDLSNAAAAGSHPVTAALTITTRDINDTTSAALPDQYYHPNGTRHVFSNGTEVPLGWEARAKPTADGWGWGVRWTCFFWAAIAFCFLVWAFFVLPEQKGIPNSDMDFCFEKKISARKFRQVARERAEEKLRDAEREARDDDEVSEAQQDMVGNQEKPSGPISIHDESPATAEKRRGAV